MTEKDDLGVCTSIGRDEFCGNIKQRDPRAVGNIKFYLQGTHTRL